MSRVVFAGSGALGAAILPILKEAEAEVVAVVELADLQTALRDRADWIVSAGFRHVIPRALLARAQDTCNVHPSFLPWGKGAHPNVWVLAHGEPAGVTVHQMTTDVDGGPIFAQRRVPTDISDTARSLYERLVRSAAELFAETWPALRAGSLQPQAQLEGGSYHRAAELRALGDINLDEQVTWRRAIDTLRALSFPPYHNLVLPSPAGYVAMDLTITRLDSRDDTGGRGPDVG